MARTNNTLRRLECWLFGHRWNRGRRLEDEHSLRFGVECVRCGAFDQRGATVWKLAKR